MEAGRPRDRMRRLDVTPGRGHAFTYRLAWFDPDRRTGTSSRTPS
jgi:hypothetical protein